MWVAAEASAEVDIRVARLKDAPGLGAEVSRIGPFDKRCSIEVTGGLNRPPMERSRSIGELFAKARLWREGRRGSGGSATGGGPTALHGGSRRPHARRIGGVGEGAHAGQREHLGRSPPTGLP